MCCVVITYWIDLLVYVDCNVWLPDLSPCISFQKISFCIQMRQASIVEDDLDHQHRPGFHGCRVRCRVGSREHGPSARQAGRPQSAQAGRLGGAGAGRGGGGDVL